MGEKKKSKANVNVQGRRMPKAAAVGTESLSSLPTTTLTVEVVAAGIVEDRLSVLLRRRGVKPQRNRLELPGVLLQDGETLEDAARRALAVVTGSTGFDGHLEQLATFGDLDRHPTIRVVSVVFVAVIAVPDERSWTDLPDGMRWYAFDEFEEEVENVPGFAFDHRSIVDAGVERIRSKLEYTDLATRFVDQPFTLVNLRRVYEAAWGVSQSAANFRRKVLTTPGFVEATGGTTTAGVGRPAELYVRGGNAVLHPAMTRPPFPRR